MGAWKVETGRGVGEIRKGRDRCEGGDQREKTGRGGPGKEGVRGVGAQGGKGKRSEGAGGTRGGGEKRKRDQNRQYCRKGHPTPGNGNIGTTQGVHTVGVGRVIIGKDRKGSGGEIIE